MASISNLAIISNITGSDLSSKDDNLLTLQEDVRGLYIDYQSTQNTLYAVVTKSSAYTAINSDFVILVDTTNNVTITLPSAVGRRGRQYYIKDSTGNAGTKNITISSAGGNIDGAGSKTITTNYGCRLVVSDNVNWFIIGSI